MALLALTIFALCFTGLAVIIAVWIVLTIVRIILAIWIIFLKVAIKVAELFETNLSEKNPAPAEERKPVPEGTAHDANTYDGPVIDLKRNEWHHVS